MNYENADQLPEGVIEIHRKGNLEAITFGRTYNGRWLYSSPSELLEKQPKEQVQEMLDGRAHLLETIAAYAEQAHVSKLAVPIVNTFNARISSLDDLPTNDAETLPGGIQLIRGEHNTFLNDGFILRPGEGAVIVTGDCHTIAFYSENPNEPVVAVHAGRNSIHQVNHEHINGSESVVFEALKQFSDPTKVHARIIAGIGPDEFTHPLDHPQYGAHNQELVDYLADFGAASPDDPEGHIDMATAIREQLLSKGMPVENITHDGLDTSTDDRLSSNRQGDRERNTILIMHRLDEVH